ncbi:hypothetical protein [Raineyella antarctica]|nr:hypothetical protein [Raineyella antarctica]
MSNVRFDMISVGRGRILAKEAGTDRIFHLVMDELFRTYRVTGPDCDLGLTPGRHEDPPVPGFYMKLDPEFFRPGAADLTVPPGAARDYAEHPASLRLPVFAELLKLEATDLMLVLQQPRVWYLVDARSPLMITGPDDLRVSEADFRDIFTEARLREILQAVVDGYAEQLRLAVRGRSEDELRRALGSLSTDQLRGLVEDEIRDRAGDWVAETAVEVFRGLIDALLTAVRDWLRDVAAPLVAQAVGEAIGPAIIGPLASAMRRQIEQEGFGALLVPGNGLLLLTLYNLRRSDALRSAPGGRLALHPAKALEALTGMPGVEPLDEAIAELMLRARRRAVEAPPGGWSDGLPTPNQPPHWLPTYEHIRYERADGSAPQPRYGIQFSEVLDIGVGYSHWSEHWQSHFGGEIHSLLATRPAFQQERYNLMQYRFLNGPVMDGDAFNDGTTNFYLLVRLGKVEEAQAVQRQRFAILWIDEQTYFTQRWRLLHPTADVLGDLFSLAHTIKDNPTWFPYSDETFWQERYWSPFDDELITEDSRMVVRRQIVAVTGYDPDRGTHEIYTICFNYGVSDYTWRWRRYPSAEQVLIDREHAQDRDPTYPDTVPTGPADAYVLVNTLDMRDDTTLQVRGTMRLGVVAPPNPPPRPDPAPALRPVRWVQRYLPADGRHVPRPYQLTGGKPAVGFGHPWDVVSEEAYRRADRYYQFGVYTDSIDSRCQYYSVELLPGDDGTVPTLADVTGAVWRNGWDDGSGYADCGSAPTPAGRLDINTVNFAWTLAHDADDPAYIDVGSGKLLRNRRCLPTISMYERTTRFKLLQRDPLGLIAVFADKRDDELQPASDLPREIVLTEDFEHSTVPDEWEQETGGVAKPPPVTTPRTIRLLVRSNTRLVHPPVVTKARVMRVKGQGKHGLRVTFWTPQDENEVCRNIWQVSLAGVDASGVLPIFQRVRFPSFVRQGQPTAPLPLDHTGELGDTWRYEWVWEDIDKEMAARIDRLCTPAGHIDYATSLWFEDVVGHVSTADLLVFE